MGSMSVVGTWRLVSSRAAELGRRRLRGPTGMPRSGFLIYGADGYMSATLMRPGRPHFASGDRLRGTPEEVRLANEGFLAYCGTYDGGRASRDHRPSRDGGGFPRTTWARTWSGASCWRTAPWRSRPSPSSGRARHGCSALSGRRRSPSARPTTPGGPAGPRDDGLVDGAADGRGESRAGCLPIGRRPCLASTSTLDPDDAAHGHAPRRGARSTDEGGMTEPAAAQAATPGGLPDGAVALPALEARRSTAAWRRSRWTSRRTAGSGPATS